jgi:hypothetical protein
MIDRYFELLTQTNPNAGWSAWPWSDAQTLGLVTLENYDCARSSCLQHIPSLERRLFRAFVVLSAEYY